ncbi:MAG TPA: hypothetical protein VL400_21680 [Polyangiaceae bacterium]|nr:hypothetical protein [Polyangiaceae bacterium]
MNSTLIRLSMLALVLGIAAPISGCDSLGSGKSSSKAKKDKDKDDDEDESKDKEKEKKKKKKKDDDDEESSESGKAKDAKTGSADTAPPPSTPPPAVGEQFAGIYTSTYGEVRMRQSGTDVSGTYPGGTLKCVPTGKTLDCDWKDSAGIGKAKLDKQPNGDLKGTWGNGVSATNGGGWLFVMKSAGDPGPSGDEAVAGSFAGEYISTYGTVTLTEGGGKVTGGYPGGKLDCTPSGAFIDCDWRDSSGTGKARLKRVATGDLDGTWGNGASNSDGGRWLFRKK